MCVFDSDTIAFRFTYVYSEAAQRYAVIITLFPHRSLGFALKILIMTMVHSLRG